MEPVCKVMKLPTRFENCRIDELTLPCKLPLSPVADGVAAPEGMGSREVVSVAGGVSEAILLGAWYDRYMVVPYWLQSRQGGEPIFDTELLEETPIQSRARPTEPRNLHRSTSSCAARPMYLFQQKHFGFDDR